MIDEKKLVEWLEKKLSDWENAVYTSHQESQYADGSIDILKITIQKIKGLKNEQG